MCSLWPKFSGCIEIWKNKLMTVNEMSTRSFMKPDKACEAI